MCGCARCLSSDYKPDEVLGRERRHITVEESFFNIIRPMCIDLAMFRTLPVSSVRLFLQASSSRWKAAVLETLSDGLCFLEEYEIDGKHERVDHET